MAQIDIKYKVANSSTGAVAQRIATLAGPGPLLASPEFFLSQVLPETYFANGASTVTQHNLEQWFLPAVLFTDEVNALDLSWTVNPSRFAAMLVLLEQANELDWTVNTGQGAWCAAHAVFMKGVLSLTKADRLVAIGDITKAAGNAAHGSCFDRITGAMLWGAAWAGGGACALSDARALLASTSRSFASSS